jgi:2-oxoisovalerate dehydrogenase E1 component
LYKTAAERAEEATRDPITKFGEWLKAQKLVDGRDLATIAKDVDREVNEAADAAVKAAKPAKDTAALWLYSPDVDPTVRGIRHADGGRGQAGHDGVRHQPHDEDEMAAIRAS